MRNNPIMVAKNAIHNAIVIFSSLVMDVELFSTAGIASSSFLHLLQNLGVGSCVAFDTE